MKEENEGVGVEWQGLEGREDLRRDWLSGWSGWGLEVLVETKKKHRSVYR